ncbi:uncharacterized protein BXZ73DRAFT_50715 [Epithele typhae]|uniref:uncharacterized protein n=1 Tax=Epithele typhae TaxID=378194 RepID=UPI002007A7CE|nr:uncharacterized protein BXZ73DRAFT_50715 [Epithele typhae]KAH9923972.1 hypothetical protein BXZ73DRAFT_50715 [Epithele typhae]
MPAKFARSGLYPAFGVTAPFDPAHELVTSYCLPPVALAALRLSIGTYAAFAVIFELVRESVRDHDAQTYLSYFTHLSYIGIIAYQFAAGVQTLLYVLNRRKSYPLQRWPRFLQFLHRLLFATITSFPIVVTAVFWALLADAQTLGTTYSRWDNISVHAMNSVFLLVEVLLTNMPPSPWTHLPICIVLLGGYLGVAYITHATQGFYSYSFLDPAKEHAMLAAYIVGIAVAECVAFALVQGLTLLRLRLTKGRAGTRPGSALSGRAPTEDWEEVEPPSPAGHAV